MDDRHLLWNLPISRDGKYLWVRQNRKGWQNGAPAAQWSITNIPAVSVNLNVWNADGFLADAPNQVIKLVEGTTSYNLTEVRTDETIMVLAAVVDSLHPQADGGAENAQFVEYSSNA